MKRIILVIFILLFAGYVRCQQDPEATKILDIVAEKTKSYKSIQADYELVIDDRKEDIQSDSKGQITIKKNKYKLESTGSIVYYDGKTMWTYTEDNQEVVITEPDTLDENFLSNPAKIFYFYNRDFKYRYVGEITIDDVKMHEIHLFPINLDQPYSRIRLYIDAERDILSFIQIVGKDGIDYNIALSNYVTDKDFDDSIFVFDNSKYRKAEIIDLRY
ncbi:MAG: outer membrane lipoprotein carrier protein LolA [Bacteroidales bacterium]|nr:MAG: outer membrane lipoprotein carrier protein LolA [Bacteroidales bacterium]